MKCFILMLMIFASYLTSASAQGIFRYERIDFFGRIDTKRDLGRVTPEENPEFIIDDWAEPIISSSGKVNVYLPPKEVRDFLEEPNPENAKAYLTWNLKRIKKFILAQELLKNEAKELEVMKESKSLLKTNSSSSINSFNGRERLKASYLFYFMSKGCPACEEESRVIEDIYLNHPEIRIEAFAKGFSDHELDGFSFSARQDNGISRLFKVESYPSIAIFNKKKQKYFLSGFVDKERILKLLE